MVSVLDSSAVKVSSRQTKDNELCAKHAALKIRSKDWLTRNRDNVSERSNMSTRALLF